MDGASGRERGTEGLARNVGVALATSLAAAVVVSLTAGCVFLGGSHPTLRAETTEDYASASSCTPTCYPIGSGGGRPEPPEPTAETESVCAYEPYALVQPRVGDDAWGEPELRPLARGGRIVPDCQFPEPAGEYAELVARAASGLELAEGDVLVAAPDARWGYLRNADDLVTDRSLTVHWYRHDQQVDANRCGETEACEESFSHTLLRFNELSYRVWEAKCLGDADDQQGCEVWAPVFAPDADERLRDDDHLRTVHYNRAAACRISARHGLVAARRLELLRERLRARDTWVTDLTYRTRWDSALSEAQLFAAATNLQTRATELFVACGGRRPVEILDREVAPAFGE